MIHYCLSSWCSACGHLGESIRGVIAALFPEWWSNAISSDPHAHLGWLWWGLVTAAPCCCPLDAGREGSLQWGLVLWRGSRAAEGSKHFKKKEVWVGVVSWWEVSITLSSSGTWDKDRIVPREICPENLYPENKKASKFSSVLAGVWRGTGYTLEAWFPLRAGTNTS